MHVPFPTSGDMDREWQDHWRVVVASFFGMAIGSVAFFTQGIFLRPLSEEFHWSRAQISAAGLFVSVVGALGLPPAGRLVARFGARRMVLTGWVVNMAAFAAIGRIGNSLAVYYMLWIVVSLGSAVAGALSLSTALSSWFERHRGLAISLAINGVNVVGVVAPPTAAWLIAGHGWRNAYGLLAAGTFSICFPLLFLWFHQRPAHERWPEKTVPPREGKPRRAAQAPDGVESMGEALADPAFWAFGFGTSLLSCSLVGLVVHFVPSLAERGLSAGIAATTLSLNSLAAIVCGVAGGFLIDRAAPAAVNLVACLSLVAAGLLLATGFGGLAGAAGAALLMGLTSGVTMPAITVFVAKRFGMRLYSAILGLQMSLFNFSQGVGSTLVSWMHDRHGNYRLAFFTIAALALTGAALFAAAAVLPVPDGRGRRQAAAADA